MTQLSSKLDQPRLRVAEWGPTLDDSEIEVERVIAYRSQMLKDAERWYIEKEALAAKEGLIKFQPFIEGEKVTLVMDHTALQWAKTYENSNQRLALWNTVYSAYAPNLEIIHTPGRVHSNVDPLSRLKCHIPENVSPLPGYAFTGKVKEEHPFRSPRVQKAVSTVVNLEEVCNRH